MYSTGQAISFIESTFGKGVQSNGGLNISVECPFCSSKKDTQGKKKLVIRTDTFILHCWVCQYRSRSLIGILKKFHPNQLQKFLTEFSDADFLEGYEHNTNQNDLSLELPAGFLFLGLAAREKYIKSVPAFKAVKYLLSRGLTEKDLWYFRLGISTKDEKYKNRIIFPSFDSEGKLNFLTARSYVPRVYPKYKNPPIPAEDIIFNECSIDWTQPLTLVEGPFDLTKCNDNATCLLGSNLTIKYKLFQKIVENNTPVVLALDNDAKKKRLKIARLLHEYGVEVRIFNVPEQYNDVGEMTKIDFLTNLPNAVLYDNSITEQIRLILEAQ